MRRFPALALLAALSACTEPMLSANMAVGAGGVSVKPALSGQVGGTTVSIEPN